MLNFLRLLYMSISINYEFVIENSDSDTANR